MHHLHPQLRAAVASAALTAASLACALAPSTLLGQASAVVVDTAMTPGSIDGVLLPPPAAAGKSLDGVTVKIVETGAVAPVDRHGAYVFKSVKPGTYTLLATGAGFSRLRITDVVVAPNHSLTLSPQPMPVITKDGEVQMMQEVIVSAKKDNVEMLEKYLVTESGVPAFSGTGNIDIPRTINDAQPYYIWDSSQIEASGASDVGTFFQRMVPMNTTKALSIQGPGNSYMGSTVTLGGLNATQNTLILVDGRPLPNVYSGLGTAGQSDLNGIPLSAIDHIEVLTASASAIYGASAAGGVVNVVLKHGYSGGELRFTYDNPFEGHAPTRSAALNYSASLEGGKTSITLSAAYQAKSALTFGDRPQIWQKYAPLYDNAYPNGGLLREVGILGSNGQPSTNSFAFGIPQPLIVSLSGAPLFSGNSAIVVQIPAGYAPNSGLAPLQANIGKYNLAHPNNSIGINPYGLEYWLTKAPLEKSLNVSVRRQMTSALEAYVEVGTSSDVDFNPSFTSVLDTEVTVPANAPGNPFGQAVQVAFNEKSHMLPDYLSNLVQQTVSAGLKLNLPHDWKADVDYSWARTSFSGKQGSADTGAIQADVTNGKLNLISDLSMYPVDLSAYLMTLILSDNSSVNTLQAKASGPLMKLWAGAPTLTAGVEHRLSGAKNTVWYSSYPGNLIVTGLSPTATNSQTINAPGSGEFDDSAYAELQMPIVSKGNGIPGVRQLDVQLAGRYDALKEYSTSPTDEFIIYQVNGVIRNSPALLNGGPEPYTPSVTRFHSSNSTVGLRYKPVDDILLRWSYSTSFVPPTLAQLRVPISTGTIIQSSGAYPGVPTSAPWPYQSITDPVLNATYTVPVMTGGHVGILPEISHGITWGVVFEPTFVQGLRVSLDFSKVAKYNDVVSPTAAQIVANAAAYPGRIVRGTPNAGQSVGPIVFIDSTAINAPLTSTSSYNLEVDYTLRTASMGTWRLSGVANSWQHYVVQGAIGAAAIEQLGNPFASGTTLANGTGAALAKVKGNVSIDWSRGPWSASWLTRYIGPYTNGAEYGIGGGLPVQGSVNGWVPGQIYHDVAVGYQFDRSTWGRGGWRGFLGGTSVRVGVKDVFNTMPPYDALGFPALRASYYGDYTLADWYMTVKKQF